MDDKQVAMQSFLTQLQKLGQAKTYAKNSYLLRADETEKHIYFIKSGAVRVFLADAHEEHTIRLGYEGSLINSLASFLAQTPSAFYIEALRKTTVLLVEKEQLEQLMQQNELYAKAYSYLIENVVIQQLEREIDLLMVSPAERLERVLKRSPNLFQHVPLKYIASYLRMSPETLSRIRNS